MTTITTRYLAVATLAALGLGSEVCWPAAGTAQELRGPVQAQAVQGNGQADEEAEIAANLAKLKPEDRKLAEAQWLCPVMDDTRLGAMDVPPKVMIKGRPVFVCCKGCVKKALADPDKTLAKVEELKAKRKAAPKQ
jgi:hypothetical protein